MNAEELGLGAILVGSLPPTLFTDEAPARYTVSAVFTRRPTRSEIDGIQAERTRQVLRAAGYGNVDVRVSDRRLEIANTNLDELSGDLAGVIADRLRVISEDSAAADRRIAADALAATRRETDRAALVALAAADVVFVPRRAGDGAQRYAASGDGAAKWQAGSTAGQAASPGSA